jgi:hypothetical protein
MSQTPQIPNEPSYPYSEAPRIAQAYAEELRVDDVTTEILRRLAGHHTVSADGFTAVHLGDRPAQVNDAEAARLVILPPQDSYDPARADTCAAVVRALSLIESHRRGSLTHRNAVVALAADAARYPRLDAVVREYLAWAHVSADLGSAHRAEVDERRRRSDVEADAHLLLTYTWVLVPDQSDESVALTIRAIDLNGGSGDLAERAAGALRANDELILRRDAHTIRADLDGALSTAWRDGHLSVGELWQLYTTLPYLPRLRDRSVLEAGLNQSIDAELDWQYSGFALADSYDRNADTYVGLRLPGHQDHPGTILASTLVVRPDRAVEQYHGEVARTSMVSSPSRH